MIDHGQLALEEYELLLPKSFSGYIDSCCLNAM